MNNFETTITNGYTLSHAIQTIINLENETIAYLNISNPPDNELLNIHQIRLDLNALANEARRINLAIQKINI